MTTPDLAAIVRGLTKAQMWFIRHLSASWVKPGEIGANPNHTSHRDRSLIEASTEAAGREYRLTPLGMQVRAYLTNPETNDEDR